MYYILLQSINLINFQKIHIITYTLKKHKYMHFDLLYSIYGFSLFKNNLGRLALIKFHSKAIFDTPLDIIVYREIFMKK